MCRKHDDVTRFDGNWFIGFPQAINQYFLETTPLVSITAIHPHRYKNCKVIENYTCICVHELKNIDNCTFLCTI